MNLGLFGVFYLYHGHLLLMTFDLLKSIECVLLSSQICYILLLC